MNPVVWIAVVVVVIYLVYAYNRFVSLRNGIENTFNQIRVAMKKRMDMIGQLVETASSYLKFEKDLMEKVTEMRRVKLTDAASMEKAENLARTVFGTIMAVAENYPKVRGIEAIKELQESIKNVETEIARLRYLYNDQVQSFNMMCERFPSNIVALLFGFRKKEYLKFGGEVEKRPETKVYQ